VNAVEHFGPVPDEIPWRGERERVKDEPVPVEMVLPIYPPIARNVDYEGVVLVAVTVEAGEVTNANIQFGDAVLVTEVLANVRTWRFAPDVSTTFTVEYDFRLEKRAASEGGNARLEMRLPQYVRVTGRSHDF
jgi:TonB family protein